MRALYPEVAVLRSHLIDVGDGHRIHMSECGRVDGQPVVFIHGGPGSGCNPDHRRYFDPSHYRVFLLDQRGCGESTPIGETTANTTDHLVGDLERVRRRLGIDRWLLFAGSWGVALALRYAQCFPRSVSGMVLRGSFLARPRDLAWFFGSRGVARMFPDAYAELLHRVPVRERADPVSAYHRRVHGTDPATALSWARGWAAWEDRVATSTLPAVQTGGEADPDPRRLLAKVRIATHYAVNRYFLAETALLPQMERLPVVPVSIVHGRRDLVCPCEAAWTLHHAIPGSRLVLLPDAGHLACEPPIVDALLGELERLKERLS